ncbi:MAG: extracellular solute-binding protein, partial [Clostridia bacterium]
FLIVNKTYCDIFAKERGAYFSFFKTFEGIRALAKKYYEWTDAATAKPNDGKAFFGRDAMANYLIIGAKQLGNDLVSTDNGKIALNIDRAVMRKLWDNFYVPFISGYFDANGKFRTDDAKTGDIIALVGSTTGASYFPKKVVAADDASYDIDTMVLPLPVFEGGTPYTAQQGAGMVVTKQDELHEIASVMFLKWFTQRDLNIDFTVASGYLPVRRDASDVEIVQKYFKNAGTEQSGKCVEQSVIESINMTKTHKFYSHKPFENSTEVRMILEKSMLSRAKADRHEVEKLIAGGLTHADAVAKLATDKNFNAWLTEFTNEMDSAIGK